MLFFKIKEKTRLEIEILASIVAVILFNSLLFTSLSPNEATGIIYFFSMQVSIAVYVFFTLLTLVLIILNKKDLIRKGFIYLLAFMTGHIIMNLYLLIIDPHINDNGQVILADALLIWFVSLLVFSLWYWIIDRGGPVARATNNDETRYDLLFPQYQTKIPGWDNWHPVYTDYLFFSFFTSTGFSPADTLPLTKRVKLLMMIEAFVSLVIIGMVASRAISLIQ